MFIEEGMGHAGGVYSIIECISVLFAKYIKDDPKDWFVLSKGHAGPAYYAALCVKGKISEEALMTSNKNGTLLPSHPDRNKTPGVDCTTGSLGQGISQAVGLAHGLKLQKKAGHVYCIIGDGECNEGEVFEAFQYAVNKKLDNLTIIIDDNKKQLDGTTKEVMNPFSIEEKMKAFGFYTQTVKGNDEEAIDKAIEKAKVIEDQAVCIILDSIKGSGVPYFEQMDANHSVKFNNDEIIKATQEAIKELNQFIEGGAR